MFYLRLLSKMKISSNGKNWHATYSPLGKTLFTCSRVVIYLCLVKYIYDIAIMKRGIVGIVQISSKKLMLKNQHIFSVLFWKSGVLTYLLDPCQWEFFLLFFFCDYFFTALFPSLWLFNFGLQIYQNLPVSLFMTPRNYFKFSVAFFKFSFFLLLQLENPHEFYVEHDIISQCPKGIDGTRHGS